MKPRLITCFQDYLEAVKDRREEMGLSHADVDHKVGWQEAYCSKVEGGDRDWGKRPFNMTSNASDHLQVLGLRVVLMPADEALKMCDGTTERRIVQIGRHGKVPKKNVSLTCTMRRRKN